MEDTAPPSDGKPPGKSTIGDLSVTFLSENQPMATVVPPSSTTNPSEAVADATDSAEGQSSRFRIVRPHAKGGLGEVSVASDTELNREVALKEIQARFASDIPNRMRFVLEAEVTGALEHPGIVPVYGLGQYEDGRPYYAMRFVRGDSLKEAVDRFHQSGGAAAEPREFRALLGRLVDVCNAIEYAHSRGVLHRDIKPSNVMLGEYGETLVVDWGLAKVMGRDDLEFGSDAEPVAVTSGDSSQTMDGSTIGTPAFMSPEQAAGDLKNLGPPADVYSLGATLFYVLTGTSAAKGETLVEILANVQAGKLQSVGEINPRVPAALGSIAAKALATAPGDRYQSPKMLADEIKRWLDDEPVLAHPDPLLVGMRRWARRHPKSVTAVTAAMLLGLGSAAAIATVVAGKNAQLADANIQLEEAYEAQTRATTAMDEARAKAEQQRKIADNKAAEATAVLEFFEQKVLAVARPEGQDGGLGIDVTVRKAIDNAAATLGDAFEDQPDVESKIRTALGETYGLLGEYSLAENEVAAAVQLMKESELEIDVLNAQSSLMEYTRLAGRVTETIGPLQRILARQTELLGPNHDQTLETAGNLAACYIQTGKNEAALEILKPTIEQLKKIDGDDSQRVLSTTSYLAGALLALGRIDEALPVTEELVEISTRKFGPRHPDTLTYLGNLSTVLSSTGNLERALEINKQVLASNTELRGPTHPSTLAARGNQASLMIQNGQPQDGVDEMVKVAKLALESFGADHPDTMKYDANLAGAYMHLNRASDALEIYESLLPRQGVQLGKSHPSYLVTLVSGGMAYTATGQTQQAKQTLQEAMKGYSELYGEDSQYVVAVQDMIDKLEPAADVEVDNKSEP